MGSVCSSSSASVVSGGRSTVSESNNNNDKENGAKSSLVTNKMVTGHKRSLSHRSATSSLSSVGGGAEIPGAVLGRVDPVPCSLLTNSKY